MIACWAAFLSFGLLFVVKVRIVFIVFLVESSNQTAFSCALSKTDIQPRHCKKIEIQKYM